MSGHYNMRAINKRTLLFCVIISVIINTSFYVQSYSAHEILKKQGIISELYVKSLSVDETTFF
jgi:hypothetical protein